MKSHKSKALKREERVPVEKNAGEGKRENQRQVRIAWLSSSSMTSIINYRDFGRVLRKNRFLRFCNLWVLVVLSLFLLLGGDWDNSTNWSWSGNLNKDSEVFYDVMF